MTSHVESLPYDIHCIVFVLPLTVLIAKAAAIWRPMCDGAAFKRRLRQPLPWQWDPEGDPPSTATGADIAFADSC